MARVTSCHRQSAAPAETASAWTRSGCGNRNGSSTPITSSRAGGTTYGSNRSAPPARNGYPPPCLAGACRCSPTRDCDGPDAYLQLRADQPRAVLRIAEILGELLDEHPDKRLGDVPDLREELRGLVVYGRLDDFDRTAVNQALGALQAQRRA